MSVCTVGGVKSRLLATFHLAPDPPPLEIKCFHSPSSAFCRVYGGHQVVVYPLRPCAALSPRILQKHRLLETTVDEYDCVAAFQVVVVVVVHKRVWGTWSCACPVIPCCPRGESLRPEFASRLTSVRPSSRFHIGLQPSVLRSHSTQKGRRIIKLRC